MDYVEEESEGSDLITSNVRRGLNEENVVYLYMIVISKSILIGRYQFFRATIKVSNMVEMGVKKYGL